MSKSTSSPYGSGPGGQAAGSSEGSICSDQTGRPAAERVMEVAADPMEVSSGERAEVPGPWWAGKVMVLIFVLGVIMARLMQFLW